MRIFVTGASGWIGSAVVLLRQSLEEHDAPARRVALLPLAPPQDRDLHRHQLPSAGMSLGLPHEFYSAVGTQLEPAQPLSITETQGHIAGSLTSIFPATP